MSLYIAPVPSQGAGGAIKWSTVFLEADNVVDLQTKIDLVSIIANPQVPQPRSFKWMADIQFSTSQMPGGNNFAVMIVIGEYNPT